MAEEGTAAAQEAAAQQQFVTDLPRMSPSVTLTPAGVEAGRQRGSQYQEQPCRRGR